MGWADAATAYIALRNLIKDNDQDKICSTKAVLGELNGSNKTFKTFEYRRLTDFASSGTAWPLGIYQNGTLISSTAVARDDLDSGTFELNTAPTDRDSIRASYYYHWFTDAELESFLQNASTWLGNGSNYLLVVDGLNAALLRFAAQEAYVAAAMKYSTRMSEVYKLEDAPSEEILKALDAFRDMAKGFMKDATALRDDYYTRQGQPKAPNYAFSLGQVTDPQPRR
jgi:hypothetical protein